MSDTIKIIADGLGWIGNICFILGALYLADKKISGFWYQVLANLMYLVQGVIFKITSLWTVSIVLIFINLLAIYNWKFRRIKS